MVGRALPANYFLQTILLSNLSLCAICPRKLTLTKGLEKMLENKKIQFIKSMARAQQQGVAPGSRKAFGATAEALSGLIKRTEALEQEVQGLKALLPLVERVDALEKEIKEPKALAPLVKRIEALEQEGHEPEEKAEEEAEEKPEE